MYFKIFYKIFFNDLYAIFIMGVKNDETLKEVFTDLNITINLLIRG